MKRRLFLLFIVALPLFSYAQGGRNNNNYNNHGPRGGNSPQQMIGVPGSALSVSSDNGERFLLILNGVKQNNYAQSRVRIEGLPQVVNDIQIIFDDNRTPALSKTITFMDPIEGGPINLSMRIMRDRNGYARLAFSRMNTLERDYRGEQGEYVMFYGRDNNGRDNNGPRQIPTPPPPPMPMDNQSFGEAVSAIKSSSFDDSKLSTAKTIANNNLFTTEQVMTICRLFSFEDRKLDFAKYAFKRTVDNQNYFKVNAVFNFDSNKTALNNYVNANR